VVTALDVNDIYQVPMEYYKRGLNKQILEHFKLPYQEPNMHKWQQVSDKINNYQHKVTIAIVGKYNKLADSYKSLIEALHHGGLYNNTKIVLKWVNSVNLKDENVAEKLAAVDAILVPGGFGNSGVDGKICAVKYARINNIPFFGICMGVQIMVIEALRHLCGIKDANSTEFNPETTNPAVGMITEWVDRSGKYKKADTKNLGGTMRLGKYHAKLSKTSKVAKIYGVNEIDERHRHRYEINIKYKSNLEAVGMNIVGLSPDGALPEIVEYSQNDWFIGVQFHPELKSKPFAPHPLFASFVAAALNFQMKNKNE
jgi:CTP synthase